MSEWGEKEFKKAVSLLKKGEAITAISNKLNRSYHSVRSKLNREGYFSRDYNKRSINKCTYCGKETKNPKYCSEPCSQSHRNKKRDEQVEKDKGIGHSDRVIKSYLIRKFGEECMNCGWSEENVYSGNIPIELNHIDGDSENNHLDNLELLCPNCHSLTKNYKALNMGNGRYYRRKRYKEGKSY